MAQSVNDLIHEQKDMSLDSKLPHKKAEQGGMHIKNQHRYSRDESLLHFWTVRIGTFAKFQFQLDILSQRLT